MTAHKKSLYAHQKAACLAAVKALKAGETPYLNIPTGGGKSLILVALMDKGLKQGLRVLVLVPSKELVEQNAQEAIEYIDSPSDIGICCSKLNKFQVHHQAVIATYTSFLRRRATSGAFDLLLIDEAHGVGYEPNSSYRKIITSLKRLCPALKIIGATATPVRMLSGRLEETYLGIEPIFTVCAYEASVQALITQGVLCHVESISGDIQVDLTGVPIVGGDYDSELASVKFAAILPHAIPDLKLKIAAYSIQTCLIFASNVANAQMIVAEWEADGSSNIRIIYGAMPAHERARDIHWLKHGEGVRAVVNINVLLIGFNFQKLDAVCFLRATKSLALYRQAVGRVLRSHSDKTMGHIVDYSGNIERHGPIDAEIPIRGKKRRAETPKKLCTALMDETLEFEGMTYRKGDTCGYSNLLSAKRCKVCGALFISENEDGSYVMRSRAQVLKAKSEETYTVGSVLFEPYAKNGVNMIKMLLYDEYMGLIHTDYICIEHTGAAKNQAVAKIMALLKDKKNYYEFGKFSGGVCVKSLLFLLGDEFYSKYFKTIKSVTLVQDGRYKRVLGLGF